MTKNDLQLLTDVLRANRNATHAIRCTSTWNGFEEGQTYDARFGQTGIVMAKDKDGIDTHISPSSCAFFELATALPPREELHQQQTNEHIARLKHLASFLLCERETYQPGELVEFIPGLANLSNPNNVFVVIEQVEPFVANPKGSPFRSNDIELLDLRVAFYDGKGDSAYLFEVFADSRRMRRWGQ